MAKKQYLTNDFSKRYNDNPEVRDTPYGPVTLDENGVWRDVDGRNSGYSDPREDKKWNNYFNNTYTKHSSASNGNTSYVLIPEPMGTDTLIHKIIGYSKDSDVASNRDFGVGFYRRFPKVSRFFDYKPDYIRYIEEYEKIKK